ncbi:flagellar hook-basal body protein [Ramlibacter sp. USB13]|uniref:Flagellar hook-basal body protein n=1 Tax=Ramlibacter cellulosilyticus TaxID=2764187 RepID=A0A923MTF5_9BURK|nr:flagellar hook-basal body protein [Ramlibacter cellulosilyticus]MBC5785090.1 flagellar hook-basal body protein [Ramlibacter cellulosilyticus]
MDPILSAVLGSMQADVTRMDRVAMNIANVQTPGFKREVVATLPFGARVAAADLARTTVHTDPRSGTLKPTSQPLDLALSGPGWFEVQAPQGTAYTRNGSFRLDAAGRLVTQQGHTVMGVGGEIVLASGTPVVDEAGRVFEAPGGVRGAAPVGQIKVVQFEGGAVLERAGDGLVFPQGTPWLAPEGAVRVQQGLLENANVSHLHEMVRLVETVRHLETLQKVALGYDEMLATSIRKLGEAA